MGVATLPPPFRAWAGPLPYYQGFSTSFAGNVPACALRHCMRISHIIAAPAVSSKSADDLVHTAAVVIKHHQCRVATELVGDGVGKTKGDGA